jgi:hypothetical protein
VSPLVGDFLSFFVLRKSLFQELCGPLGTYPLRGVPPALDEGSFAGRSAPRGLRRDQTLGEGFNERKRPFPESNPALGKGPKSGSGVFS